MIWKLCILFSAPEILLLLLEMIFKGKSSDFTSSIDINAPADLVWGIASARSGKYGRLFPFFFESEERSDQPGTFIVRFRYWWWWSPCTICLRELERREGQAILYELIPEHTDPDLIFGPNHYMAFEVKPKGRGAQLTAIHRIEINRTSTRIVLPYSLKRILRIIKRHAERLVRT